MGKRGVSRVFEIKHGVAVDIAGLRHCQAEIRNVIGERAALKKQLLTLACTLRPEWSNPHDRNAVGILVDGHRIGYLQRDHAEQYSPLLLKMNSAGARVSTSIRLRWYPAEGRPGMAAGVHGTVKLAQPEDIERSWLA